MYIKDWSEDDKTRRYCSEKSGCDYCAYLYRGRCNLMEELKGKFEEQEKFTDFDDFLIDRYDGYFEFEDVTQEVVERETYKNGCKFYTDINDSRAWD